MNIRKALVVDDEFILREQMEAFIRTMFPRCEVVPCDSLEAAREAIKTQGPFDFVLTDFNIPNGSEGAEVSQTAKLASSDTLVMVASGMADLDSKTIQGLCGADGYIKKPFTIDQFSAAFKKATEKYLAHAA